MLLWGLRAFQSNPPALTPAPHSFAPARPRDLNARDHAARRTRQPTARAAVSSTRRVSVSLSRFKTYNDETRDSRELATAANRERSGYRLIAPGSRVRPRPRRCGTARPAGGSRGAVEPPRSRSPPRDARTARSTPERPLSAIGIAVSATRPTPCSPTRGGAAGRSGGAGGSVATLSSVGRPGERN